MNTAEGSLPQCPPGPLCALPGRDLLGGHHERAEKLFAQCPPGPVCALPGRDLLEGHHEPAEISFAQCPRDTCVRCQAKISRSVTLSHMRKEGIDVSALSPEELEAVLAQRRAARAAAAAAKEVERAARQQVCILLPTIQISHSQHMA